MKQRVLGKSGLKVSCIGLGCMGMSEFYGPSDDQASENLIKKAIDLGINLFDTADSFGIGHNEMLLGHALRGIDRDKVIISTKFGFMRRIDGEFMGINGHPNYVKSACNKSLRRLGVDHIDLYFQHRVDPEVPIEETMGAMADLVKAGKVRFLGLCEASPATIRRANAVHPLTALQTELSLWSRDALGEILSTTRELGMAFVAYSPLGRGFLTGLFKKHNQFLPEDFRALHPRMSGENFEINRRFVEGLERFATIKGHTAAQLALAWVLAQGEDIVPIPGTRREYFLLENIQGSRLNLTHQEVAEIGALIPPTEIAGTRYDENGMRRLDL